MDWCYRGLRYSETKTFSAPFRSPQVLHRLVRDRSRTSAENCSLSFIATQNGTNSYLRTSKALKQKHMRSTFTAYHRLDLHTRKLFSCYLLHVSTKMAILGKYTFYNLPNHNVICNAVFEIFGSSERSRSVDW